MVITKSQKRITIKAVTAEDVQMLYAMAMWAYDRLIQIDPSDPLMKIRSGATPFNVKDFKFYLESIINECTRE